MNALPRGLAFRFLLHEFVFQLRYQSLTFSYLTGAFSLPITYAVILKILGDTAGKPAFGAATIAGVVALGAIEVVTVQIVLATLNDKHAGMLDYRLAAPVRFDLAALGRYGAIVVQSLVAYPVVMISAVQYLADALPVSYLTRWCADHIAHRSAPFPWAGFTLVSLAWIIGGLLVNVLIHRVAGRSLKPA